MKRSRRTTIKQISTGIIGAGLFGMYSCNDKKKDEVISLAVEANKQPFFSVSLAQWSLHKSFFGDALQAGFESFSKMLRTNPESALKGVGPDGFS